MTTTLFQLGRIGHVSLRVRNLDRSVAFYGAMLGLRQDRARSSGVMSRRCVVSDGQPGGVSLTLSQGLPQGSEICGLDYFSFLAGSEEEVDAVYQLAQKQGVRVTHPRVYGGHYQVFVFDPDGYKIEIRAEATE